MAFTNGTKRRKAYVSILFSVGTVAAIIVLGLHSWPYQVIGVLAAIDFGSEMNNLTELGFTSRSDNEQ